MTNEQIAAAAVAANGRAVVVETTEQMAASGAPQDIPVASDGPQLTISSLNALAQSADPSILPTPDLAEGPGNVASATTPTTFPTRGSAINNDYTWSMPGMYVQVSYCNAQGCNVVDKVTATVLKTDPGTNGLKAQANMLDLMPGDSLTKVHFQSWLYSESTNYTKPYNCGSVLCVNTFSQDSGGVVWGIGASTPMKNRFIFGAYRFWAYHAARNVWVWMDGKTGKSWCPYPTAGDPTTPCQY